MRYICYRSLALFVVTVMAVGVGIPEIVAAGNDLVYETVLQTRSWCQDPPKYLYAGRRKAQVPRLSTPATSPTLPAARPSGAQSLAFTQSSQLLATSLSCSGRGRPPSTGRSWPKRYDISRCEFNMGRIFMGPKQPICFGPPAHGDGVS